MAATFLLLLVASLACVAFAMDKRSYMETIDSDARIFVWHHFLTDGAGRCGGGVEI